MSRLATTGTCSAILAFVVVIVGCSSVASPPPNDCRPEVVQLSAPVFAAAPFGTDVLLALDVPDARCGAQLVTLHERAIQQLAGPPCVPTERALDVETIDGAPALLVEDSSARSVRVFRWMAGEWVGTPSVRATQSRPSWLLGTGDGPIVVCDGGAQCWRLAGGVFVAEEPLGCSPSSLARSGERLLVVCEDPPVARLVGRGGVPPSSAEVGDAECCRTSCSVTTTGFVGLGGVTDIGGAARQLSFVEDGASGCIAVPLQEPRFLGSVVECRTPPGYLVLGGGTPHVELVDPQHGARTTRLEGSVTTRGGWALIAPSGDLVSGGGTEGDHVALLVGDRMSTHVDVWRAAAWPGCVAQ